jgi:SOS-response transcriptional repressor LexA
VRSLTRRQQTCLWAIKVHRERTGIMPTQEDLRVAISAASKSTVHRLLKGLEKRGAILLQPRTSRGIMIVGETCPHCGKPLDALQAGAA